MGPREKEESTRVKTHLVYASKYWLGGKIMRDIMRKEFYGKVRPLVEQPPLDSFMRIKIGEESSEIPGEKCCQLGRN